MATPRKSAASASSTSACPPATAGQGGIPSRMIRQSAAPVITVAVAMSPLGPRQLRSVAPICSHSADQRKCRRCTACSLQSCKTRRAGLPCVAGGTSKPENPFAQRNASAHAEGPHSDRQAARCHRGRTRAGTCAHGMARRGRRHGPRRPLRRQRGRCRGRARDGATVGCHRAGRRGRGRRGARISPRRRWLAAGRRPAAGRRRGERRRGRVDRLISGEVGRTLHVRRPLRPLRRHVVLRCAGGQRPGAH